jgi:hypothetical protein
MSAANTYKFFPVLPHRPSQSENDVGLSIPSRAIDMMVDLFLVSSIYFNMKPH